jgi:DNA polymerase III delta prime subunit
LSKDSSILIEKWRPTKFEDVILTDELTAYFRKCIYEEKSIPHLLLFGKAGIGKTTIGKVIASELGADFLYINGSKENTINIMRDKIYRFATTYSDSSVWDDTSVKIKKIVFIDECEKITFQEALKIVLEELEGNVRFILATNDISKIIDPIKGERCQVWNLEPSDQSQRAKLAVKYTARLETILKAENIKYDVAVLKKIVVQTFPSLRKAISTCHKTYLTYGEITNDLVFDNILNQKFVEVIASKDFPAIRKFVANTDPDNFFSEFMDNFWKYLPNAEEKTKVAEAWAEYATKRLPFNDNKEAVLFAFFITVMKYNFAIPAVAK